MDYSGFDRDDWPRRTVAQHRRTASEILKCNTKASIAAKESGSGYRYTKLLELPYFDPTRMLVIDPMHNLYLGTGKHILKDIWSDREIIHESKFDEIQDRIDRMVMPPDIGRIPNKIKSGFSKFTADQLKNWIVYFSIIALKGLLDSNDLECWRHFVLACRILSSKVLQLTEIQLADALLMQFCKRVEQRYGKEAITPNMHMHTHLRECILDFGPSHGFWLFAFERYNGLMGKQPSNNRSIEVQFMQCFIDNHKPLHVPNEHQREFSNLFGGQQVVGTLSETLSKTPTATPHSTISGNKWTIDSLAVNLPKYYSRGIFAQSEVESLLNLYSKMFSLSASKIEVPSAFHKFQSITINDRILGSYRSRSSSSSTVMAHPDCTTSEQRPVRINFFARHTAIMDGCRKTFLLFSASWFKPHRDKDILGKPVTVWECDIFEISGVDCFCFSPVQLITKRTVSLVDDIHTNESALFVP